MFRTYPLMKDSGKASGGQNYKINHPTHRMAQMALYRWTYDEASFVNVSSCADLYDTLIGGVELCRIVSKRAFGSTIVNAMDYECRRLVGVSKDNPKIKQVYHFWSAEELRYGLEYMICPWLRKFLNDQRAPGEPELVGPEIMAEELDMLGGSDESTWKEMYLEPMMSIDAYRMAEPDWRAELKKNSMMIHG